jgi:hypothetical protein
MTSGIHADSVHMPNFGRKRDSGHMLDSGRMPDSG